LASRDATPSDPFDLVTLGFGSITPAEELLLAIQSYVVGLFEAGAWVINGGDLHSRDMKTDGCTKWLGSRSEAGNLYTLVRHSRELFDHRDLEHGALCLRRRFSSMEVILSEEDPFAVWELMNTIPYLHEVGWTEVLRLFLNQLAEMSAITHNRSHPIYRMFEHLRGLLSSEMLHVMALMRQCAAEEVENITGPTDISTLKLRLGWLRSLSLMQSRESVEEVFGTLLEISQAQVSQAGVHSLLILESHRTQSPGTLVLQGS
jgi:hypothetical protein